MPIPPQQTVYYKRARFTTRLPTGHIYTPSHYWLRETEPNVWQIGFTRFASRMLGDLVEHQFDVESSASVAAGDTIGWIEGFKAVADIFCAANGEFLGANPALQQGLTVVERDLYDAGWLYSVRGDPDERSMKVEDYARLLDGVIDRILSQEESEKANEC